MNHDEIKRMAKEADIDYPFGPELYRFAVLVAAAERERLDDKFMHIHYSQQHSNNYWHFAARKIKEEA